MSQQDSWTSVGESVTNETDFWQEFQLILHSIKRCEKSDI